MALGHIPAEERIGLFQSVVELIFRDRRYCPDAAARRRWCWSRNPRRALRTSFCTCQVPPLGECVRRVEFLWKGAAFDDVGR
ncbi:hypothetical protein HYQ46_006794 [Verticillium longisporum]|nr:hypothetical protein HYQ46_006794 [Verticillium longisporum]